MDCGSSGRVRSCVLIADDLTGACDSGVHFAHQGLDTVVYLEPPFHECAAEVPVFNTRSRSLVAAEAEALVAEAVSVAPPCRVLYKKVDSTLHGHVAIELMATLREPRLSAVFAPAYPAMGRVVRGGVLYAPGCEPMPLAHFLPAEAMRVPSVESAADCPGSVYVPDIETADDLRRVAAAALEHCKRLVLAGSGGFAREIAALIGAEDASRPALPRARNYGPVVFFLGSHNVVTLRQAQHLRNSEPSCRIVFVHLEDGHQPSADWHALMDTARAVLFCGGDTAQLVCSCTGATAMRLRSEIVPGVPWATLRGGQYDGMPVATKAGGFGPEDALTRVAQFFLQQ